MISESNNPGAARGTLVEVPNTSPNVPAQPDVGTAGLGQRVAPLLVFILAFSLSAVYMFSCLRTGWLPQDDGTLAQSALRVLQGQLPHRDFAENYTGGLSYIHAGAFRLFGVNLVALRLCLFLFFLAWLPALFFIVSRFSSPATAAGITLLAVAWTVPNYPVPMPSWYNLFFATFGAAALFRYLERGAHRWLFLAGVCGGLSFLIKVVGLYYVAGVVLFLLFREQNLNASRRPSAQEAIPSPGSEQAPRLSQARGEKVGRPIRASWGYRSLIAAGLMVFLAGLVWLTRGRLDDRELLHFLLPAGTLATLLLVRELRVIPADNRTRFLALSRMALPFVAGALVPVLLFLIPYALSDSLAAFGHGVFGGALNRVQALGLLRPPHWYVGRPALPLLLLLVAALYWKRAAHPVAVTAVALALAVLLLAGQRILWTYIWDSVVLLTPLVVVVGVVFLSIGKGIPRPSLSFSKDRPETREGSDSFVRQEQLMLLLALAAVCSVVQFPFSAPIYFCYFAALPLLAMAALLAMAKRPASPCMLAAILAFYALFPVIRMEPNRIYELWTLSPSGDTMPFLTEPAPPLKVLHLERAGGVQIEFPEIYEAAVQLLRQHAANGVLIATPEIPALYFLSGLRNPTRDDNNVSAEELEKAIRQDGVQVIAINGRSTFAQSTLTPELAELISRNFPFGRRFGPIWVYWRGWN